MVVRIGDNTGELLDGTSAYDTIFGNGGADLLFGRGGTDSLYGSDGDDFIVGGAGVDRIDGGAGIDVASYYDAPGGVSVSLATGQGTAGDAAGDILVLIENLSGSAHGDVLSGDAGANTIWGNSGGDEIIGGGGADTLYGNNGDDGFAGNSGADRIFGGEGRDRVTFLNAANGVTVDLAAGTGSGGDAAGDSYDGVEDVYGSGKADVIRGNGVANRLDGWTGNDTLHGGGGRDVLNGSVGNDRLFGGSGNDVLHGSDDRDVMTGGAGVDVFTYGDSVHSSPGASSRDRITDFAGGAGGDRLDLSEMASYLDGGLSFVGQQAFSAGGQVRYSFVGADTLISVAEVAPGAVTMEILLEGHVTLTAANFIF